ncbi:MAG: hypothetical protein IKN39_02165 [Clostridia bacterium]|nr:hypothetical protein [Clostridia bacterium]
MALALSLFGNTEASRSMYPYNTDNNIKMLISLNRTGKYEEIADSIIEQNEYAYIAYGEKARGAYYKGDFTSLIRYKNLVFEYAPLNYNEYEEYCYMLINGVMLYNNAGDRNSAEICKRQILLTKKEYESNLEKVSGLGLKIKDKPKQRFPDDIETYIYKLNKGEGQ